MELAAGLERPLAKVCSAGPTEVRENGESLAALGGLQNEVRSEGDRALLNLWGARQSLVRRAAPVAEQSREHVVLRIPPPGNARHAKLEFLAASRDHEDRRWDRAQFRTRLQQLLIDPFPDEIVDSLATSADLHHSTSGSCTRGLMHRGRTPKPC
jgi:hypothetical protein